GGALGWLKTPPPLPAFLVLNDLVARGALGGWRSLGRRVPEDVSVVGFDDIPFAALANPPLTTVGQPIRQLGEQAADLLLTVIEHGSGAGAEVPPPSVLLPNRLIQRQSSGGAPR